MCGCVRVCVGVWGGGGWGGGGVRCLGVWGWVWGVGVGGGGSGCGGGGVGGGVGVGMDEIRSHHFETMTNHCLLVFRRIIIPWFQSGAGFCPSTVGVLQTTSTTKDTLLLFLFASHRHLACVRPLKQCQPTCEATVKCSNAPLRHLDT